LYYGPLLFLLKAASTSDDPKNVPTTAKITYHRETYPFSTPFRERIARPPAKGIRRSRTGPAIL